MAVVYRARDLSLERTVALKVIAPELASNAKFRQRFVRESEIAASIDHPNIIPIYAAGEADQLLYLVMRYVPGEDLGAVLSQRGALRPREALPLFTQVAGALDAAHAHQLVHRDVKPGNILLSGTEELSQRHVYLSDFGLTKRLSSLTGFTTTGHFLGTIQYVAPEQVANRPVDHRTDIYSLGCVIYEALAGEPPFVGENDAALLWCHMTQDPPPISSRRHDLPSTLDPVFTKALSKRPEERQANCRALIADLREAFRPPSHTLPTTKRPAQREAPPRPRPAVGAVERAARGPAPRDRPASAEDSSITRPHTTVKGNASGRQGDHAETRRWQPHITRLTAGVLALILTAGLAAWLVADHVWGWEEYSGNQFNEAAVRLEHPREWHPELHSGQFVVFGPTDLTSLFTPSSDWADIRSLSASAHEQVVGAYVDSTGGLDAANSLDPLPDQLEQKLRTSAIIDAKEQQPDGAPPGTQGLVGTMTPPSGASAPRLYFELIALRETGRQGLVMLFCLENDKKDNSATFKRILESVRLHS